MFLQKFEKIHVFKCRVCKFPVVATQRLCPNCAAEDPGLSLIAQMAYMGVMLVVLWLPAHFILSLIWPAKSLEGFDVGFLTSGLVFCFLHYLLKKILADKTSLALCWGWSRLKTAKPVVDDRQNAWPALEQKAKQTRRLSK